jgi:hypothetical protein
VTEIGETNRNLFSICLNSYVAKSQFEDSSPVVKRQETFPQKVKFSRYRPEQAPGYPEG